MLRPLVMCLPLTLLVPALSAHAQTGPEPTSDKQPAPALARDMPTDMDDRTITNHCIDSRGDTAACLCVTKILKYELSLQDYRTLASRVAPPDNAIPPLAIDKYRMEADQPAVPMDPVIRTLLDDTMMSERCGIADRYFERR